MCFVLGAAMPVMGAAYQVNLMFGGVFHRRSGHASRPWIRDALARVRPRVLMLPSMRRWYSRPRSNTYPTVPS